MIDGNEILDLLYKPMGDEKVLNIMEQLGMKVPFPHSQRLRWECRTYMTEVLHVR